MTAAGERYLVTGAMGCIGAWTVRALVRDGAAVTAFDLGADTRRLAQIMTPDELAAVDVVQGDITDLAALSAILDDRGVTNVIHLAALQVPFCRADPPRGALVNVVGTVNVFEAVKRARRRHGAASSTRARSGCSRADDADPPPAGSPPRRRPIPTTTTASTSRPTRATPGSTGWRTASGASACGR